MNDIVIYYSRTWKTKLVAKTIAKEIAADTQEIKDLTNRSGLRGFVKGVIDIKFNANTEISPERVDLKDYDTIYIGSPVWGARIAPAIMQLVNNCDFEGKNVITFVTMSGSGSDNALSELNNQIKTKKGNITNSFAIITKNTDIPKLTKKALKDLEN